MWPLWAVALYIHIKIICTIHQWENWNCPLYTLTCYIDVPFKAGLTVNTYWCWPNLIKMWKFSIGSLYCQIILLIYVNGRISCHVHSKVKFRDNTLMDLAVSNFITFIVRLKFQKVLIMSITTATFRNVVFRTPLVAPVIIWTTPMTFVILVTSIIISIVWLSVMMWSPVSLIFVGSYCIVRSIVSDWFIVAIVVIKSFFVFSVLRTSHTCKYHQENLQNKNKYMHHVIKMERYMQLLVGHLRRIVSVSNTSTYLNVSIYILFDYFFNSWFVYVYIFVC